MATLAHRPRKTSHLPPKAPDASPKAPEPAPNAPERPPDRRVVGLLGGAAIALVTILVAVVALSGGPSGPPPATGAARLVPADALLYFNLSTDHARPPVRRALASSRRFPASALLFAALTRRLDDILSGSSGVPVDFATDVRPWLGKEAAFALLNTTTTSAGSLIVLDVRSRPRANAFLTDVAAARYGYYHGVPLLDQPSGTVLAFVGHYLVLGQAAGVQSAIDAAKGRTPSLYASSTYRAAAAGEPPDRVLEAYASAAGIRRVLLPRTGLLGALGVVLNQAASRATTISLSAASDEVRLRIHTALDPAQLQGAAPSVEFSPTLAGVLPPRSILLLDVTGLRRSAPKLFAAAGTVGVLGKISSLLARLGAGLRAEGVDVNPILSLFSGETALAITPARGSSGPAPVIVTRTNHPQAARQLLGGLEASLTQLFAPPSSGPGQAPEVTDVQVGPATIHELALAPGFQLDFAVAHGLIIVSTSPSGVATVISRSGALDKARGFQATLGDHPDPVTSLLFFDLSRLLALGEQNGLIGRPRQAALSPALEAIRAVGLASTSGATDTTTELHLQIP